jgi:hypothetical protein
VASKAQEDAEAAGSDTSEASAGREREATQASEASVH